MSYQNKISNLPGIDSIFVLSVKTFTDRIEHIKNELAKQAIEYRFIFDFDIPDITDEIEKKYFIENTRLSKGARSLILKNILAWQICVEKKFERILILEDDAVLHKNFKSLINAVVNETNNIPESYYIFLGGAHSKIPTNFYLGNSPIIPLKGDTTEGYLIDNVACQILINWLETNKIDLPIDGLLNTISKDIGITQYWSTTVLVEQGSMYGLFDSQLDAKRSKRTKFNNIIRYKLVVFKRRTLYRLYYRVKNKLFKK